MATPFFGDQPEHIDYVAAAASVNDMSHDDCFVLTFKDIISEIWAHDSEFEEANTRPSNDPSDDEAGMTDSDRHVHFEDEVANDAADSEPGWGCKE